MKTKIAALALSAASLGGIGATALATNANASSPQPYVHHSANYTSSAQCNSYRSSVSNTIRSKGGMYVSIDSTCHASGGHYTYGAIRYLSAKGPLISGDTYDLD